MTRNDNSVAQAQTHRAEETIQREIVPSDLCGSTEIEMRLDGIDWELGLGD